MLSAFALVLRLCLTAVLSVALALLRSTNPSFGADGGS